MSNILTRSDVAALRSADSRTFHSDITSDYERHVIKLTTNDGWTREIEVSGTVRDYAFVRYDGHGNHYHAFAWDLSNSEGIATVWRHVKAGDTLEFQWVRNNNTPTLRDYGLVRDDFYIIVRNDDKGRRDKYFIASHTGRDDSARMVREAR